MREQVGEKVVVLFRERCDPEFGEVEIICRRYDAQITYRVRAILTLFLLRP